MKCQFCSGEGMIEEWAGELRYFTDCWHCRGTGGVSWWDPISWWFWDHVPVRVLEFLDRHKGGRP